MAKVVRFHETGGPEVLRYEDAEVGEPGPGQVRMRHVAVGLNYADTYFRNGTYPVDLQRYALEDAVQAHRDLESRKTTGSSIFVI
ncbi:putative NAD(P)H quinone oxidoreductase, PIG3 family [compost metagenome]